MTGGAAAESAEETPKRRAVKKRRIAKGAAFAVFKLNSSAKDERRRQTMLNICFLGDMLLRTRGWSVSPKDKLPYRDMFN